MKFSSLIVVVAVVVIAGIIYYSTQGGQSPAQYAGQIQHERDEKNSFMKNSSESPFQQYKVPFDGLQYFAPDLHYRVHARLQPLENKHVRIIRTSDQKENQYIEFANAVFQLDGREHRLLILEILGPDPRQGELFLGFADATSANETYGGGRYLDLERVRGATSIDLDFNKAYNPYCAYTEGFSCPLPPKENILGIAIPAGEKNYH